MYSLLYLRDGISDVLARDSIIRVLKVCTCPRQQVSGNTNGEFVMRTGFFWHKHKFCESLFPDISYLEQVPVSMGLPGRLGSLT